MSLTRLHPNYRDLPYSGRIPDAAWYTGSGFTVFYQGFTVEANGCCNSYRPLYISGTVGCCPESCDTFLDVVAYTVRNKRAILDNEIATWSFSGGSFTLESEICLTDLPLSDSISLADYQSRLSFSLDGAISEEGFSVDQTAFWDMEREFICPCESGYVFDPAICDCVEEEDPCSPPSGGCPSGQYFDSTTCACTDIPDPPEPTSVVDPGGIEPELGSYESVDPSIPYSNCTAGQCPVLYDIYFSFRVRTLQRCTNSGTVLDPNYVSPWQTFTNGQITARGPFTHIEICPIGSSDCMMMVSVLDGFVQMGCIGVTGTCNTNLFPGFRAQSQFEILSIEYVPRVGSDCCPPPSTRRDGCQNTIVSNCGEFELDILLQPREVYGLVAPAFSRKLRVPGCVGSEPTLIFDLEATPPTWGVVYPNGDSIILNFPVSGFFFYEANLRGIKFIPRGS